VKSDIGKKLLRARQIIMEGVIGEAKTLHLLNRCRYRRLEMFKIQLLLRASVINLKRLMKRRSSRSNESAISKMVVLYYTVIAFLLFKLSGVWQQPQKFTDSNNALCQWPSLITIFFLLRAF